MIIFTVFLLYLCKIRKNHQVKNIYLLHIVMASLCLSTTGLEAQAVWLKGAVKAEENGEPLPYATLSFYSRGDSTLARTALTDDHGDFGLSIDPGNYYALLQYVGFEDTYVAGIEIVSGSDTLNAGTFYMSVSAVKLDEVNVVAEKSQMELKLDKRVFNVGSDLTNSGMNAADILDKVPSVTVDPEGNVSLRGSPGVQILVDGKPSGLLSTGDTRALLRMQGDIIESIEVITNPSARYEAEGEAGIINIILKKNKDKGINGSFSATVGYPKNAGAAYSLNFHRDKLNFFSNFGMDYRKTPGGGNSSQTFYDGNQQTASYTTETDQTRGGLGGYLQVGTDWSINPYNTITGSLLYRAGKGDNVGSVLYHDFDEAGNLINSRTRSFNEVEPEQNLETALSYKRTFSAKDRVWTVDFKYILDDDTELADYTETGDDLEEPLYQESSNTEDQSNILIQTDYIHPIGNKSKLESGLRATLRNVNNDYYVKQIDENGDLELLPEFNDFLKYKENIYAAYFIGAHEFGALSVQAGVRAELSDITARLINSGDISDQYYLNLFPSASVSYKVSGKDQLQLSYSRRLSRPSFRNLLPFSNYFDPRNNIVGNPNLRPEYTNSFETGWLRYFRSGSLLSTIYYRRTTGVIERLILPADDGTTIRYPVNLGIRNAFGFEFNFQYNLLDWWDATADLNFYRAIVDGNYDETDYSADTYTFNGRVTSKWNVGNKCKIQASYNYDAPRNTPQGRMLSSGSFDIAASLDIIRGKGTLVLSARDIFDTRKRRSIIDLPEYESESVFQWRKSQQVVLTFNYRLNKEKEPGEDFGSDNDFN